MRKLMMFVIVIGLINNLSCSPDKNEVTLPPETHQGKNTFGCLLNQTIWINGSTSFGSPSLISTIKNKTLTIHAEKAFGLTGESISIQIIKFKNTGR